MIKINSTLAFERIKSTDFPLPCRGMYYFAKGRHDHQQRKGNGYPYYVHPRGVAFIVMMCGGNIDQINAAFAHDLLEDTDTSFMEIASVANSIHCAELCSELRNNKYDIKEIGKTEYMTNKLIEMSEDALLVKLADILYNISDVPTEAAKNRMIENVKMLSKSNGSADLSEAHKELISEILKHE